MLKLLEAWWFREYYDDRRWELSRRSPVATADDADPATGDPVRLSYPQKLFAQEKPEYVVVAAAIVGGIHANNSRPAEFIYENLQVQNNLVHGAYLSGVRKLLFLGSSCIYPRLAPQPLKEEYLLSGPLLWAKQRRAAIPA